MSSSYEFVTDARSPKRHKVLSLWVGDLRGPRAGSNSQSGACSIDLIAPRVPPGCDRNLEKIDLGDVGYRAQCQIGLLTKKAQSLEISVLVICGVHG